MPVISCGFLPRNGVIGICSCVAPSTYVLPSNLPHANMRGIAILIHTASMTFILGCVSREKYSVVDVFKQYAETYIFISNSSNVGSQPHISTILSRMGPKSTKPNLLKKEPIRILTNSGTFKDRDTFNISSTDIPKARNRANIEPADDPEISLTSTRLDSIAFRVPIIEYIPIDAGPNTRYFILLLNRRKE